MQAMDIAAEQSTATVTAEKVFSRSFDMLEMQLELSCSSVASTAYSAELIGETLMDNVLDKVPMSQQDRTLYLLRNIGKKLRKDPEEAKGYMDEFMLILASEPSYQHLVQRIGEF